uniref:Uncharacterized protein n=1 Tax=Globodera rostochiensis TaxID=31243 RepID=A0A914H4H3_GLORO
MAISLFLSPLASQRRSHSHRSRPAVVVVVHLCPPPGDVFVGYVLFGLLAVPLHRADTDWPEQDNNNNNSKQFMNDYLHVSVAGVNVQKLHRPIDQPKKLSATVLIVRPSVVRSLLI